MGIRRAVYLFCSLLFLAALTLSNAVTPTHYRAPFNRSSFPSTFVFGAASAAFQVEGAASEGGRGPSIWDTFVRQHPEKIWDRTTGDVAIDFYHRYKEDIHMLKNVGLDAYRLSFSWSRILPKGTIAGGVNKEGVNFYNNVINEILLQGLKPFVTLFHWDLPQALEDEHGGFLSSAIVKPFRDYADICYKLFGDRVKHWITLNEPFSYSQYGYATGTFAPGRCSNYVGTCEKGNSGTEPYIVAHNLLLSHAAAAQVYKQKYQKLQKGEVGITLASHWFQPLDDSVPAFKSSRRMLDFYVGWYLHPIVYGDYPPSMRALVGKRLPVFSKEQSKLLQQSMDFLGMNYYTARYTTPALSFNRVNLSYTTDPRALLLTEKNGIPIGEPTALDWLFICPEGIKSLMLYIKDKYKNPPVYITENGMADKNIETLPLKEALKDDARIKYFEGHYWYLLEAIKEGANVKGHFCWTFLDDFEWDAGLTVRFGIAYVDYKNGLKRHYKKSAYWLQNFLLKVIH